MTTNQPTTQHQPDDRDDDGLLELYVLDMLSDAERTEVENMLLRDPQARDRVRELRSVSAMLAFDLEPTQPSAGLRSRILDAARSDVGDRVPDPTSAPAPISLAERRDARATSSRGGGRWMPWAVAAMLAVALVGSLAWNAALRSQLDERVVTDAYAIVAIGPAEGTDGEVLVVENQDSALVALSNLPALESGQVYQVWLIDDGDPVPNVTFQPNVAGAASIAVPGNVAAYRTLAITVEPSGGSTAPTTNPIISSTLTD